MATIQLKRGNKTAFATIKLKQGEPAYILDTGELFVGNGTENILINKPHDDKVKSVNGKVGSVTITKADVGLSNVGNESKDTMFTNPTFTGTTSAPTPTDNDNTTKIATTAFVKRALDSKTSISGNSATATKLQTSRRISLSGGVTGNVMFDGSSDVTINATLSDIDGGTF